MADRSSDPTAARNFMLEVEGRLMGYFTEVDGLGVEVEVETVAEGGQNQYEWKIPGRLKWTNITLKRGITDNKVLFEWIEEVSGDGFSGNRNQVELTSGKVTLMDSTTKTIIAWTFYGGFPVRWTGPTLAASSNDIAVEELEIAHHGLKIE